MNTFLHPVTETNFGKYNPEDVKDALEIRQELTQERIEKLISVPAVDRTFENTMLAFSKAGEEYMQTVGIIVDLQMVLGPKWDASSEYAMQKATAYFTDLLQDKRIYDAILELKANSLPGLSKNEIRLMDETIEDFEREGILLQAEDKARLKEIQIRLSELGVEFSRITTEKDNKAGILFSSEEDLDGMDAEFIQECKENAKERDLDGYWVAYSPPTTMALLSTATSRDTRHAYYKMFATIHGDENETLARETLSLRKEIAGMLGYPNYAEYAIHRRMAKNAKEAIGFIDSLIDKYKEAINKEHKELLEFARDYENDPKLELELYESISALDGFYARKLRDKLFNVDEDSLKEYFEISNVLSAMFSAFTKMYGVTFKEDQNLDVWHEDVKSYRLFNEAGIEIAVVRCDWYYREGKSSGAWMNSFNDANRRNGDFSVPHSGYVVGNLPKPTATKPSLLGLRDIETIWHEFGHFIHFAFSSTELVEQSMGAVKRDFIEAPSQIMENFIWEPEVMAMYAKHYKTGEPVPANMIAKIKQGRSFRAASRASRQFSWAKTDLVLHTSYDPEGTESVVDCYQSVKNSMAPVPTAPYDALVLSFSHIFSGGYAAGYYSYKWAEAIQADLYSRFEREGALNPNTGREYRDKVLARGDEEHPNQLIRDFLGRDSSLDAMLAADGIV